MIWIRFWVRRLAYYMFKWTGTWTMDVVLELPDGSKEKVGYLDMLESMDQITRKPHVFFTVSPKND